MQTELQENLKKFVEESEENNYHYSLGEDIENHIDNEIIDEVKDEIEIISEFLYGNDDSYQLHSYGGGLYGKVMKKEMETWDE